MCISPFYLLSIIKKERNKSARYLACRHCTCDEYRFQIFFSRHYSSPPIVSVSPIFAFPIVSGTLGCHFWMRFPEYRIIRSEEHTSELQSRFDLVCRLLLEKKK